MKVLFSIAVFLCLVVVLGIVTAATLPREVSEAPHPDDDDF